MKQNEMSARALSMEELESLGLTSWFLHVASSEQTTATTPYSPILSQNTKPVATTPINIWHFSWNQPKISLPLHRQNLD